MVFFIVVFYYGFKKFYKLFIFVRIFLVVCVVFLLFFVYWLYMYFCKKRREDFVMRLNDDDGVGEIIKVL